MWADTDVRRRIEEGGEHIVPNNFYSSIPSLEEIETSFEYAGSDHPDTAPAVFDDFGIYDLGRSKETLETLSKWTGEFTAPIESGGTQGFRWKNSAFSYSDAMAYYCMIREYRPSRLVEVGSGFSTFVASAAMGRNGEGGVTCVDPEPRTDIASVEQVEWLAKKAQDLPVDWYVGELNSGDFLFVDGSHTVKTGSDCVYLLLKVVPHLKSGVLVHVHDVRLPYPRNVNALKTPKLYWGEQYLVHALLLNRQRYEVIWATELLRRRSKETLREFMAGAYPPGGVSLWFRVL